MRGQLGIQGRGFRNFIPFFFSVICLTKAYNFCHQMDIRWTNEKRARAIACMMITKALWSWVMYSITSPNFRVTWSITSTNFGDRINHVTLKWSDMTNHINQLQSDRINHVNQKLDDMIIHVTLKLSAMLDHVMSCKFLSQPNLSQISRESFFIFLSQTKLNSLQTSWKISQARTLDYLDWVEI